MDFINIIINNTDYTLVDIYNYNNQNIFHFSNDDEDLLCSKKDNEYIPLTDMDLVNKIKNDYYLFFPEILFGSQKEILSPYGVKNVQRISGEQRGRFFNEQIEYLKDILDKTTLLQRLKNVNIKTADFSEKIGYAAAFYHPASNSIYMCNDDLFSEDIEDKRLRLHETIHAITRIYWLLYIISK